MIALAAALALASAPKPMARIDGGVLEPFFKLKAVDQRQVAPRLLAVQVGPFFLDFEPVTQAEYLAFVRQNPQWRRSAAPRLLADGRYLSRWAGDLEPPKGDPARTPVTEVSWFAAKAFCAARAARLPSTAEWELALFDLGRDRPAVTKRIVEWYQSPRGDAGPGPANGYGVRDLAERHWEWTLDFDPAP